MLKEYSFSTQQAGQMCTHYAAARISPSDTRSPGRQLIGPCHCIHNQARRITGENSQTRSKCEEFCPKSAKSRLGAGS